MTTRIASLDSALRTMTDICLLPKRSDGIHEFDERQVMAGEVRLKVVMERGVEKRRKRRLCRESEREKNHEKDAAVVEGKGKGK